MPNEKRQFGISARPTPRLSMLRRAFNLARREWQLPVSVLFSVLTVCLAWHVVYGKNGLSTWFEKRGEDRELRREINDLNQENLRLRDRIEQLKTNPDAIRMVAHDQLRLARPNEVIVNLPPDKPPQPQPANTVR